MSRLSISTPCPATSGLPLPAGKRLSLYSVGPDDTANIEYTRAIDFEYTKTKPRRPSSFQRKPRKDVAITIFEDVLEDEELVVEAKQERPVNTLLAKPAQKPARRQIPAKAYEEAGRRDALQSIGQARQVKSPGLSPGVLNDIIAAQPTHEHKVESTIRKEPRRRTIFVPSDDTTLLTIHPGAQTTERLDDTFQLPHVRKATSPQHQSSVQAARNQPFKRQRLSMAAAPQRPALQSMAIHHVSNNTGIDVAGRNGGKENVPPNNYDIGVHAKGEKEKIIEPGKAAPARSSLFQPTAASIARQSMLARQPAPLSRRSVQVPAFQTTSRQSPITTEEGRQKARTSPPKAPKAQGSPTLKVEQKQTQLRSSARRISRLPQYPVLTEDIAQPELYEDSWLSHQEVALTEVINQIFSDTERRTQNLESFTNKTLRERLVTLYHQPDVTTLYKRLQASLQCGALSRPKDAQSPPDPALDIGLRKRFLGLWLDSYDQKILCAAAEVVFGHQLPKHNPGSPSTTLGGSGIDPHNDRRSLIAFLETFLINVEDAAETDQAGYNAEMDPRWRKAVLRSIMLIWLLDQAKFRGIWQGCLFKAASSRKSSTEMLHSLATLLIPSIGDVTRVLRHLSYDISHVQDPLAEVVYRIENLAVDLRDGIKLTRLVELLLFSHRKLSSTELQPDATVTIKMPDLTTLESALYDTYGSRCPRVLSQHLKMPCLGRAQKIYNVDIALCALRDHGRLSADANDISAEDIVDGHREKTLSLLWCLVSTHGLDQLVDFETLAKDIKHTSDGTVDVQALPTDFQGLSHEEHESLLKKWAVVHCARNGVRVSNLTTAFADGKAYIALIDDYQTYSSSRGDISASSTGKPQLHDQLRSFGCSTAFINQIASNTGHIPSRKTTVSNLAFLASRLLPLSRNWDAAVTIQRAVRHCQGKQALFRRIQLMHMAHACAAVVQTQHHITAAATCLQRAWRRVLAARDRKLHDDVALFQCMAKGWIIRRRSQLNEKRQALRVMGGW